MACSLHVGLKFTTFVVHSCAQVHICARLEAVVDDLLSTNRQASSMMLEGVLIYCLVFQGDTDEADSSNG